MRSSYTRALPLAAFALAATGIAQAVQPDAKTVPWVASNPVIPHDAISGQATMLKGMASLPGGAMSPPATMQYSWDFGDGTSTAFAIVTAANLYALEASHVYTGAIGDTFVARLTVRDSATGESDTANYIVALRADVLETDVNVAIDNGLWYLHKTISRTGAPATGTGVWNNGTSGSSSYTSNQAANVTAFFVNGHLETGADSNPYTETVQRGMRTVFAGLNALAIGNQTYPAPIGTVNPDSNGNGYGVQVNGTDPPYQGGLVIDAIVASNTPNAVTTTGPLPSGANPGVQGRTYGAIVQDMVDMYVWGQSDNSPYNGWRYGWNYGQSDNSTNQWAAIGIIGAERGFGSTVPSFVKQANINSIGITQDALGRFGYTNSPSPAWGYMAVTPSGMVQMVMDGIGRGDARWNNAEAYMRANFCNEGGAGNAVRDYYYGLFSLTKSLLLHDSNGDGIAEPITNLGTGAGPLNSPTGPLDWYGAQVSEGAQCDGVARRLVGDQFADGHWLGNYYGSPQYLFETSFAIIMLNRTVFQSGQPVAVPVAVPNPAVAFQTVNFNGAGSFHQDPSKTIVSWAWDLDNDGAYDDATGVNASRSFPAVGNYTVGLRVCDASTPALCDTGSVVVNVATPPIAPTADAGGPYNFCPGPQWFLNGSGSNNPDEGQNEPGQPANTVIAYDWDIDFDGAFDDAAGVQPNVTAAVGALGTGSHIIRLRVTDNTAASYPSSGQPNLTDVDDAQVNVRAITDPACACINSLVARAKPGQVQVVWTAQSPAPAGGYKVFRSLVAGGPYVQIATTTSTYSTYLDTGLVNGTTYYYVVRPAALNGDELCQSNQASATPRTR